MPCLDSLETTVETYLARSQVRFLRKNGTIFWGEAPRSSPRGLLGFQGKAELPFNFIDLLLFTLRCQLGCWACILQQKDLEILAKGRSDVAAGCSKRW
jgi:hypothetical protein